MVSVIINIITNLISNRIDRYLNLGGLLAVINKRTRYLKSLKNEINKMPFLYQDVNLESLSHYIDIEFHSIDLKTLNKKDESTGTSNQTVLNKLKWFDKVIFLGNAGIGKTTFLRKSTIRLIDKEKVEYLDNRKGIVPIYIALKIIDNSDKSPILNYILNNNTLFKGATGKTKLIKLAEESKLYIILDGYDEIGFIGKHHTNYIREELMVLMSHNGDTSRSKEINPSYKNIYNAISKNKIWLSSRKEFYLRNDLQLTQFKHDNVGSEYLVPVGISGLGNNRVKLVTNIFNIYKSRNSKLINLLDSEYFIGQIDRTSDEALIEMSQNPLFLTVLTYMYVRSVADSGIETISLDTNISAVISRCVKLLLLDLDKEKIINTPNLGKQSAFIKRRSDFLEEKMKFLNYFSAMLYQNKLNVFSESHLEKFMLAFLENEYDGANALALIKGVQSGTKDSISNQLLFSGLFVTVGKLNDDFQFDFPHRRFREVLAATYYQNDNNIKQLLSQIDQIDYGELISVVYKETNRHNEIFDEILNKIFSGFSEVYFQRILLKIKTSGKNSTEYNPKIIERISNAITYDKYFTLDKLVLPNNLEAKYSTTELIHYIDQSITDSKLNSASALIDLLVTLYKPASFKLINHNLFSSNNNTKAKILYLIKNTLINYENILDFYKIWLIKTKISNSITEGITIDPSRIKSIAVEYFTQETNQWSANSPLVLDIKQINRISSRELNHKRNIPENILNTDSILKYYAELIVALRCSRDKRGLKYIYDIVNNLSEVDTINKIVLYYCLYHYNYTLFNKYLYQHKSVETKADETMLLDEISSSSASNTNYQGIFNRYKEIVWAYAEKQIDLLQEIDLSDIFSTNIVVTKTYNILGQGSNNTKLEVSESVEKKKVIPIFNLISRSDTGVLISNKWFSSVESDPTHIELLNDYKSMVLNKVNRIKTMLNSSGIFPNDDQLYELYSDVKVVYKFETDRYSSFEHKLINCEPIRFQIKNYFRLISADIGLSIHIDQMHTILETLSPKTNRFIQGVIKEELFEDNIEY